MKSASPSLKDGACVKLKLARTGLKNGILRELVQETCVLNDTDGKQVEGEQTVRNKYGCLCHGDPT